MSKIRIFDGAGRLFIGLGLGLLIIFICGLTGYSLGSEASSLDFSFSTRPTIGRPAPDFELIDLSGQRVHLSELVGKPVMINFWATWCTPCVAEMPYIQEQHDAHQGEVIILAINGDEPESTVRNFIQDHQYSFTVLLDPEGRIMDRYRITGYPTSVFIDAEGDVQAILVGSLDRTEFNIYLHKIGVGQ